MDRKREARSKLVKQLITNTQGREFTTTAIRKDSTEAVVFTSRLVEIIDDTVKVSLSKDKGERTFSTSEVLNIKIDGHFIEFNKEDVLGVL